MKRNRKKMFYQGSLFVFHCDYSFVITKFSIINSFLRSRLLATVKNSLPHLLSPGQMKEVWYYKTKL